jgi:DNA polymerase III delta prime subunit
MDRTASGTMLEVGGNITATGNITAYYSSDKRLKDNLIPIQNPFDKINKIGGYEFDWKPEYEEVHNSKGHDVGVIAQEIETSMPELVGKMHGGYMGVKYEKLTVYLLEAVKNLNNRLIELEEENKKLKG